MPKTGLHQIECFNDDQVARDQGDIVGTDERDGGGMTLIRPIDEGKLSRGIGENKARGRVTGHDVPRRGLDGGLG